MDGTVLLPRDPAERRRLWHEWTHTDTPAAPKVVVRRSTVLQDDWLPAAIDAPSAVIAGLSRAVRESLVGGRLPYGDRSRLIARAGRLGLNRFEANLLIAAVVNRTRPLDATRNTPRGRQDFRLGPIVMFIIASEAVLGSALWYFTVRHAIG